MLETVIVQSVNPLTLHVSDVDPNEMLVVKSISGLTSPKVGLFTGDYASEGSYYQGRRGEKLTPVLNLKMNPQYAEDVEVSDIRELLYRAFYQPQPGSVVNGKFVENDGVKVLLQDDRMPDRYFIGYTEDINTDQFSRDTSVQISMMCMSSYLFSNALTSASDVAGWLTTPIPYDGTAKVGLEMTLKINTATSVLTVDLNGALLVLNRSFAVGEIVKINTRSGERSIVVGSTDIMGAMSPTSKFVQLDRPANTIKVYGSAVGDGKVVLTNYNFRSQWWGI